MCICSRCNKIYLFMLSYSQFIYNIKNKSSFIMSKSSSKNLSNENKHWRLCCLLNKICIQMPILCMYISDIVIKYDLYDPFVWLLKVRCCPLHFNEWMNCNKRILFKFKKTKTRKLHNLDTVNILSYMILCSSYNAMRHKLRTHEGQIPNSFRPKFNF